MTIVAMNTSGTFYLVRRPFYGMLALLRWQGSMTDQTSHHILKTLVPLTSRVGALTNRLDGGTLLQELIEFRFRQNNGYVVPCSFVWW